MSSSQKPSTTGSDKDLSPPPSPVHVLEMTPHNLKSERLQRTQRKSFFRCPCLLILLIIIICIFYICILAAPYFLFDNVKDLPMGIMVFTPLAFIQVTLLICVWPKTNHFSFFTNICCILTYEPINWEEIQERLKEKGLTPTPELVMGQSFQQEMEPEMSIQVPPIVSVVPQAQTDETCNFVAQPEVIVQVNQCDEKKGIENI